MSSIIRARSALPGRWEGWEVIGGSSTELKVAGPSMLGIGCPDRHALLLTSFHGRPKCTDRDARHPARAGSFLGQIETCLTTEPWSAVGWIADRQPTRASFSAVWLLIPPVQPAVPSRAIPCSAAP